MTRAEFELALRVLLETSWNENQAGISLARRAEIRQDLRDLLRSAEPLGYTGKELADLSQKFCNAWRNENAKPAKPSIQSLNARKRRPKPDRISWAWKEYGR